MRLPSGPPPIIRIANGTFYRHQPGTVSAVQHAHAHPNPALFQGLSFELPARSTTPHNWCVVGPSLSGKTTLLQLLRGQHLCFPPTARSFPYLSTSEVPYHLRTPARAIQYVGFDSQGGGGLGPATSTYLSARYESRREITDFSLRDFLLGNMQLNPSKLPDDEGVDQKLFERVVVDLRLSNLLDLPVSFLSNGQGRRARIARALLTSPEVLLLDEPFMGLDPPTVAGLSPLLHSLAEKASPRLVLSARPQDPLPDWITHLVYLRSDTQIGAIGEKSIVMETLKQYVHGVRTGRLVEDETLPVHALGEMGRTLTKDGIAGEGMAEDFSISLADGRAQQEVAPAAGKSSAEALVEMSGCTVKYGDRVALGNWTENRDGQPTSGLYWTVRRGERWGVFGPNGSGKTTIVSLLCSDHPQTYSLPIKLFGRSRLPETGSGQRPLTFWDIQSRVGHSSPEIHQHMPRSLTIRQVLESAWADTFRAKPKLDDDATTEQVEATLRWFEHELNPAYKRKAGPPASQDASSASVAWAGDYMFGELSFSAQRILLFLRAIIKHPDIVVLDEAFGGMDDAVRDKCMLFLAYGEEKMYELAPKQGGGALAGAAVVDSPAAKSGRVKVKGLTERQALICISHVKEEVPDCVREWLCLPEANTGLPARTGQLDGPLRTSSRRWDERDATDKPVHILGTNGLGQFIAYGLGRNNGKLGRAVPRLLFESHSLVVNWSRAGRAIRYRARPNGVCQSAKYLSTDLVAPPGPDGSGPVVRDTLGWDTPTTVPIENLIVTSNAVQTVALLSHLRHRLGRDSHIMFVNNAVGVPDEVSRAVFPDPATRPTYWLGFCNARIRRRENSSFSLICARRGPLYMAPAPGVEIPEDADAPGLVHQCLDADTLDAALCPPALLLGMKLRRHAIDSIIEPLSALARCTNGELLESEEAVQFSSGLAKEAAVIASVLHSEAYPNMLTAYSDKSLRRKVEKILSRSPQSATGMLRDLHDGRPTEIDYLNGYLVAQGKRLGLPTQHHEEIVQRIKQAESLGAGSRRVGS